MPRPCEDVQAFFKRYYAPNNAVLTLVGDFKSDEALAKIKKYFGGIPAQPAPPKPDVSEPEQKAERRTTIEDKFAQVPRLDVVYKIPPGDTKDFYALDVLDRCPVGRPRPRASTRSWSRRSSCPCRPSAARYEHRGPSLALFIAYVRPGSDPDGNRES